MTGENAVSESQEDSLVEAQDTPYAQLNVAQQQQRLSELAVVFLKLGTIAFGGPAAHIAMMDDELVKQRQWMSRDRLLDLLGVTNLIPGPNSTELAIHIGYERAGWKGLVIAGTCFILPAMLIVWALAAVYVRFQTIPEVGWLLYGVKPVIIAIVLQALWKLGKAAIKDVPTAIAGAVVIAAFFFNVNELVLLLLAGLGVTLHRHLRRDAGRRDLGDVGQDLPRAAHRPRQPGLPEGLSRRRRRDDCARQHRARQLVTGAPLRRGREAAAQAQGRRSRRQARLRPDA